ncbi:MAG: MBL fold metallo-hydrolase [Candidatus Goldbacteria bacterium]|nr:MBL fold metallo-hydrolase [Candidatus Goldiibacteriota bacterium]
MDILKSIHFIHHACFRIEIDNIVIYIDPWKIKSPKKANFIFVTHEHYDHFSVPDIELIADENTNIILPDNIAGELSGYKIKKVKQGDVFNFENIKIEVIPAYNVNKNFHRKSDNKVGYVIEVKGNRIYHAGDTDLIDEMKNLKNINIALLPVGGTYTMNAIEAARAAEIIKPDIAIPMHYGIITGSLKDAETFKKECKVKVEILKEEG